MNLKVGDNLVGSKVRIVFKIPGVHRKPREVVARCIAAEDNKLVLSGRPKFGTTEVEVKHVLGVWLTGAPIHEPTIYRGGDETRLA